MVSLESIRTSNLEASNLENLVAVFGMFCVFLRCLPAFAASFTLPNRFATLFTARITRWSLCFAFT